METLETTQSPNLTRTADGTLRIGATRVALESVIHHFKLGATAEEVAHKFPALQLAQVYSVFAYFLNNQAAVEQYLQAQETASDELQARIEACCQSDAEKMRARILARWEQAHITSKP